MLPIEAEIHLKALTLFGNITRANKTSVEWRLAERQLQLKTHTSKSWFIQIKKICLKYDLPDCQNFLTYPLGKFQWKKLITRKIYTYWREKINENSEGYSSLQHIACAYKIKTIHPILTTNTSNCRDINRIPIRTKVATGNYILQSNRAKFNKCEVSATCKICNKEDETIEHFLISCIHLEPDRERLLKVIREQCLRLKSENLEQMEKHFSATDWVVFVITLVIPSCIGIYHGFTGGRQRTTREFLMADRKMSCLPVAVSILVSFQSAILILGAPAEMYTKGTQYYLYTFGQMLAVVMATILFVPLFYPLKMTSMYELIYTGIASFSPSTALFKQATIEVGGIDHIWKLNDEWDRITFWNFNPDPTTRHTFWALVIGGMINWAGTYGASQASIQRFSSLPTLRDAKRSLSSILSSMVAVTWEDVMKPYFKDKSEENKAWITRILVIVYGALGIGTTFLFKNLKGTVLQASLSFMGAAGGALNGLIMLGAFFPWANWKGAVAGSLSSYVITMWVGIGKYTVVGIKENLPFPNSTCENSNHNNTDKINSTMLPFNTTDHTGEYFTVFGQTSSSDAALNEL
ncbi:SLC5A6 [Mytilus edulis]|uniref:SLC5A6 n=1 Tax=Mytilus edulis TaxID=6550 RepID=A0A8S3TZQ7_MYTED|nr:SLC5A6 [Mytilus edulis]